MTESVRLSLASLPSAHRCLLTAFLVTIGFGYAAGLYFVRHTTNVSPAGTIQQFRGNEDIPIDEIGEIKYAKDTLEMMSIIHTHVTSFALIYLAIGSIFLLSSFDPRLKIVMAVEPFAGTLLLFGGMAGLRYLGEGPSGVLAWIMIAAGALTTLCFYVMVLLSLFDIWKNTVTDASGR